MLLVTSEHSQVPHCIFPLRFRHTAVFFASSSLPRSWSQAGVFFSCVPSGKCNILESDALLLGVFNTVHRPTPANIPQPQRNTACLTMSVLLWGSINDPDDGGSKLLWNVGHYLPGCTAQRPKRQQFSSIFLIYLWWRCQYEGIAVYCFWMLI
jgi:hypothetical protein